MTNMVIQYTNMKTASIVIIIWILFVIGILWIGHKANWQMCDDPQVCNAI
jgi:heme/copper-type cytochrome/quinol oxidase subunit 4